jgi:2-hydroxychromene-2-carboxylate isomerase
MALSFDVYWSFRSPYSYLVTQPLLAIERRYDVAVVVKPVLPLAIRTPEFFEHLNPQWAPYLMRDCKRLAEMQGVPFAWPSPDPVVQDRATRRFPPEQPYIHRLTRLGVVASERGRGLAFIAEVSRLIFGGTRQWHEGDHLAAAARRAGVELGDLEAVSAADTARCDARIKQNEAEQLAAGHWGVPLMAFAGEPFFGQDRIDVLLWRLRQAGLVERSPARE